MTTPITIPETEKRYQCRHIHTDGRRCGSPSLRHQNFCYYHHTTRKPIAHSELARRREAVSAHEARQQVFDLPLPEDRSAIQYSIGEVLRRIASNEIDPKRAGLLLYGLQIASLNLPPQARTTEQPTQIPDYVEEIIEDETYGLLAPEAELQEKQAPKTLEQILLEQWEKDKEDYQMESEGCAMITQVEGAAAHTDSDAGLSWGQSLPTVQATVHQKLPTLQATATPYLIKKRLQHRPHLLIREGLGDIAL